MTAHQLARQLLAGPDLPVHFNYDYGDRGHTSVAPEVENVDRSTVRDSAYHQMPKVVEDSGDPVILLS